MTSTPKMGLCRCSRERPPWSLPTIVGGGEEAESEFSFCSAGGFVDKVPSGLYLDIAPSST